MLGLAGRVFAILLCLCMHHADLADSRLGGDELGSSSSDVGADCVPDITDMTDYDPVTQTSARCERLKREKLQARYTCETNLADAQRNLERCLEGKAVDPCPPPAQCDCETNAVAYSCPDAIKADDMFFFRLTRHLVNVLQNKAPDQGPLEAQMEIHLTSHEWKKLQSYVEGKNGYRMADIHDILVGMTIDIFHFNQTSVFEWIGETINFRSPGLILLMMTVCVILIVFGVGMYSDLYWNARFRGCLLTSIFLSSLIWNWIYLYQEETIKRYRNAQKYEDIPASCMPQNMSWSQVLMEWYRTTLTVQSDPCFDYHRLYLVDPVLDIHPARVLAFTVSSIFVEPMKYFGRAVSEFHGEIFRGLPFWAALTSLLSCYIFIFVLMYAYIAAPRRIQRERPYPEVPQERVLPQAINQHPRPQIQAKRDEDEEEDEAHMCEDQEQNRVENVRRPTLPPKDREDRQDHRGEQLPRNQRQDRGRDIPPGLLGHAKPEGKDRNRGNISPDDRRRSPGDRQRSPGDYQRSQGNPQEFTYDTQSPADVTYRMAQRTQGLSHDQSHPRGLSPEDPDTRYQGDNSQQDPAVRPKSINSRILERHLDEDGNEADVSNFSGVEPLPIRRPTDLGRDSPTKSKARSMRPIARTSSVGDTNTGNVVSHPTSETSDMESLAGSVVGLQEVPGETTDPSTLEETTASEAIEGATPVSIDSPSDISVISQSPENTNSATYDFISMPGDQESPSVDDSSQYELEHDDEDEFIILEKSHQAERSHES